MFGEDPKGYPNNIFPIICNTAIGIQKFLKIYGHDWPTKDGTTIRDYIHVMDLAEAHIKILNHILENDPTYFHLNLGTGKGSSIMELINTFEKVNGVKVPFVYSERRPGDNCFVVADNSLSINKYNIRQKKKSKKDMCIGWMEMEKNESKRLLIINFSYLRFLFLYLRSFKNNTNNYIIKIR